MERRDNGSYSTLSLKMSRLLWRKYRIGRASTLSGWTWNKWLLLSPSEALNSYNLEDMCKKEDLSTLWASTSTKWKKCSQLIRSSLKWKHFKKCSRSARCFGLNLKEKEWPVLWDKALNMGSIYTSYSSVEIIYCCRLRRVRCRCRWKILINKRERCGRKHIERMHSGRVR